MTFARRPAAALLLCSTTCFAGPALAQSTTETEAQRLFDEGLALMRAGNYGEACPKLLKSVEMSPGMGAKYRLAECYEAAGKTASAHALFEQVADEAKKAGRADREQQAREHAEALRPKLPRLTVKVGAAVASLPGVEITRDGVPLDRTLWDRAFPLDPGEHLVGATAPGKAPFRQRVLLQPAGAITVDLSALPDAAAAADPVAPGAPVAAPSAERPTASRGWPAQRIAALVVGGAGVAGVVLGGVFGAMAKSKWDEALTGCRGPEGTRCSDTAIGLGDDAATQATVSTVGFVAGGVLVAGGVVLWLTAPSAKPAATAARLRPAPFELELSPSFGPGGAYGALRGRF
jgi:hypothetical protein